MSDVLDEDAVLEVRERIIRLARIWDEESVEPAEDFADALIADLGLEHVGWFVRFPSGIEAINLTPFRNESDLGGKQEPVFRVASGRNSES